VTPEDVIFSFNAFKQNSPQLSAYYQHVTKAEKTGEREITFTFDAPGNRELPQIVGEINVLPKHWYEGTDKSGKKARHFGHVARASARQWRLPAEGIRAGPFDRL
jgi:microcin C transport system substrate-binding protein